ncbi:hypothetical protein [Aeromicrobium wangtongii]|uniref:Uncharacterized protein n=1 Tax=Aeromicrobium wangtongii TaxID=2969247 RepID=A0ABY5MCE5_9ACTN|nr:hypothetical protein [Aeromicrobium wangtongii]MCD9197095.1 hypothetical protein [Aeromicrobium wangtongii]UUP14594.1 hypothetical protein NQV15_04585 [Aeromicrobium wangtongii]
MADLVIDGPMLEHVKANFKNIADLLGQPARTMKNVDAAVLRGAPGGDWEGKAARALRDLMDDELTPKIVDAHRSFSQAHPHISTWSSDLWDFQFRARGVEREAAEAKERAERKRAEDDLGAALRAGPAGLHPGPAVPGAARADPQRRRPGDALPVGRRKHPKRPPADRRAARGSDRHVRDGQRRPRDGDPRAHLAGVLAQGQPGVRPVRRHRRLHQIKDWAAGGFGGPTGEAGLEIEFRLPPDYSDLLQPSEDEAARAVHADLRVLVDGLAMWRHRLVEAGFAMHGIVALPAGPDVPRPVHWFVLAGLVDVPADDVVDVGVLAERLLRAALGPGAYTEAFPSDMGWGFGLVTTAALPDQATELGALVATISAHAVVRAAGTGEDPEGDGA